jgi:hypothetical protein
MGAVLELQPSVSLISRGIRIKATLTAVSLPFLIDTTLPQPYQKAGRVPGFILSQLRKVANQRQSNSSSLRFEGNKFLIDYAASPQGGFPD